MRDLLDVEMPDPKEFVMKCFPETFLAMLAGCTGMEDVMKASEQSELAAAIPMLSGFQGRRTAHRSGEGMEVP